ncbi:MAG TPA: hypothetical protein VNX68_17215, partial [Nitrosopumilaceae archaeon]|nr:hypothetical protein [Nitrosopumilaceae archaeon]
SSVSTDNSKFVSIKSYEQVKNSLMLNYEAIGRKPGNQSCSILVTIGGNPMQKIAIPIIAYVKPNP